VLIAHLSDLHLRDAGDAPWRERQLDPHRRASFPITSPSPATLAVRPGFRARLIRARRAGGSRRALPSEF
jgi:hypothetical protein